MIPFSSTSISDKTEHLHALEQANTTSHRINHRTAWVEKDRNDHPGVEPHATGQSRQPLECLQGWGIHNLFRQPVPVHHHPLSEILPPNI